jgi:predicted Zn-dependent protease
LSGSQHAVQRGLLSFSRANEQAADQAALGYLDRLGASASGMLSTFELLRRHEHRQYGAPNPYALTHPLSRERVEHVRAHVEKSAIPAGSYPAPLDTAHGRMRAKLHAFLELPPKTFARFAAGDRGVPARMARAIAWYKIPEIGKALAEVDGLIAEYPKDPFLYDLKGQILFENGRIRESRDAYTKAVSLLPNAPLLLMALGEARIATNDPGEIARAAQELQRASRLDNSHARASPRCCPKAAPGRSVPRTSNAWPP